MPKYLVSVKRFFCEDSDYEEAVVVAESRMEALRAFAGADAELGGVEEEDLETGAVDVEWYSGDHLIVLRGIEEVNYFFKSCECCHGSGKVKVFDEP